MTNIIANAGSDLLRFPNGTVLNANRGIYIGTGAMLAIDARYGADNTVIATRSPGVSRSTGCM